MTTERSLPLLALIVLLILCLGLIVTHQLGFLAPAERFVIQLITPLQQAASRLATRLGGLRIDVADTQRLRQQNTSLTREVESLRSLVISLRAAESENRLLRDQLGFSQANPAMDLLPAQVIGRDPNNFVQTLVIDRGTRDGVREGKVVVAAAQVSLPAGQGSQQNAEKITTVQGLVGRVIEAGPNYARVLLITDGSSGVNVLLQGRQAEGLLVGQGPAPMALKFVRQGEQLLAGDLLLTSGLGATFPRNLPAGMVVEVQTQDQATFQSATVAPLIDLARLSVVFVIRSFDPIRIGG